MLARRLQVWPIDRLKPYEKNPRLHSDQQVAEIAASILEFGFCNPILVASDAGIIAGHGRLMAARRLDLKRVPVLVLDHLTEVQRRAYVLADNRLAESATWDKALLASEMKALLDDDFALPILGFTTEEFEAMLGAGYSGESSEVDPDQVPEPPDDPKTRPGDLWILGEHRLLCGDSGDPVAVDRLLAGAPVHLVNTDPPYNVRVEPRSFRSIAAGNSSFWSGEGPRPQGMTHHQGFDAARNPKILKTRKKLRAKDRTLVNDFVSERAYDAMLLAWFGNMARVLLPGRSFYIWGGYSNAANYPPALKATKLFFSQSIIWVKGWPVLTRKDFLGDHEWCFYGWKEGAAHYFTAQIHNATDVWAVKKINPQSMVHLTEKPVELAVRAMTYSSRPGENVLDLFGGSGSTMMAAQQTGRKCFSMEMDSAYCDVMVERFEKFAGIKATLER